MDELNSLGKLVFEGLEAYLPPYCQLKGPLMRSFVASLCYQAYVKQQGWSLESREAGELRQAIIENKATVPFIIHDKVCRCLRNLKGKARMIPRIQMFGLPTKDNKVTQNGITYWAEPGGSNRYPSIIIRFYLEGKDDSDRDRSLGSIMYEEFDSHPWWIYLQGVRDIVSKDEDIAIAIQKVLAELTKNKPPAE